MVNGLPPLKRSGGERDGDDQYRRLYAAFRAAGHDDEAADCL